MPKHKGPLPLRFMLAMIYFHIKISPGIDVCMWPAYFDRSAPSCVGCPKMFYDYLTYYRSQIPWFTQFMHLIPKSAKCSCFSKAQTTRLHISCILPYPVDDACVFIIIFVIFSELYASFWQCA